MARPRRAGPTRSIFMITVVDQQSPWLRPSSTLAATTQLQLGANMMSQGTGNPTSQPATSTRLRPTRSDMRPAKRLARAFTAPKLTMKERMADFEARAKSCSAMSGGTARSWPPAPRQVAGQIVVADADELAHPLLVYLRPAGDDDHRRPEGHHPAHPGGESGAQRHLVHAGDVP